MSKLTADMTLAEKVAVLLSQPDVALKIAIREFDLLDEFDSDIASRFKLQIYKRRGILRRRLFISEVEDIYQKFRNMATNNEMDVDLMDIDYSTRSDCLLDLNMSYGKFASNRMSKACNEKERVLGRKLSREEILEEYREIDAELCRTLMTRAGK